MMNTEPFGDSLVVTMEVSRLDSSVAVDFKNQVFGFIDSGNTDLVIDMSNVEFVDSSGLGAMVSGLKKLGSTGSMAVVALTPAVSKMFEMTRLNRVFSIHDSCQQALEAK